MPVITGAMIGFTIMGRYAMGILDTLYSRATGQSMQIHKPELWPHNAHDFSIFLAVEVNKAIKKYSPNYELFVRISLVTYEKSSHYQPNNDVPAFVSKAAIAGAILTGLVTDNVKMINRNPNIN
jgi:hypothetical protein